MENRRIVKHKWTFLITQGRNSEQKKRDDLVHAVFTRILKSSLFCMLQ